MTSINQEMINKANTKCDAYEAPHLTIIPLRTSGAMLVGSALGDGANPLSFEFSSIASEPGNTATEWSGASSDQGWSNSFFSNLAE